MELKLIETKKISYDPNKCNLGCWTMNDFESLFISVFNLKKIYIYSFSDFQIYRQEWKTAFPWIILSDEFL